MPNAGSYLRLIGSKPVQDLPWDIVSILSCAGANPRPWRNDLYDLTSPSAGLVPTASQTVGPFFSIGLGPCVGGNLVPAKVAAGAKVVSIRGRVMDGAGQAVPDAILEIWRADDRGEYACSEEECDAGGVPPGFARIPTNEFGEFEFATQKPGPTTGQDGEPHAPHLTVLIFMRGLLRHL